MARQKVNLYHADCFDVLPKVKADSVGLVLCDMPYGTSACKWDSVLPLTNLWGEYMRLCTTAVLTASQPFTSVLVTSNLTWFKYALVWRKSRTGGFLDAKYRPLKQHEDVLVFSAGGCSNGCRTPMTYTPQGLRPTDVAWTAKPESSVTRSGPNKSGRRLVTNYPRSVLEFDSDSRPVHPTQKPVALMEYLIRTYTNPGDTVLDNCMGSGTTGVACVQTGRKFIGIEKDEKYFEIAKQRIEAARFIKH